MSTTAPSCARPRARCCLGAHLIRQLAARPGAEAQRLRLLDNLSAGSVRALMDLPPGPQYAFLEADLLSPGALRAALEGVDAVLHLAAVVRTPFAFDQPASVTQVNHWGTVQLLERCREAGVKRLIYASSASVYGPGEELTETAPCRPSAPIPAPSTRASTRCWRHRMSSSPPRCCAWAPSMAARPG